MLYILDLMELCMCFAIHVQKYLCGKAVFLVHQDLSCQVKLHDYN